MLSRYLKPKYAGVWFALALLYPLLFLPLRSQFWLGEKLGRLLFGLLKSRRHITCVNLKLCFKDHDDQTIHDMAQQVFINTGIGLFESMLAWYRPHVFHGLKQQGLITIEGLEHIEAALQNQQGVLLQGFHSTMLDLGGLLCSMYFDSHIVYRPQNNALLERIVHQRRSGIFASQIAHKDVRSLVKQLKRAQVVWYAPDQDYGLKHGVVAPFFGVPAATIIAGRRLVRMSGAQVIAVHFYRTSAPTQKYPSYKIALSPSVSNYPTNDAVKDAESINTLIEENVRCAPTQYMWFHKRFKTPISGQKNPYV